MVRNKFLVLIFVLISSIIFTGCGSTDSSSEDNQLGVSVISCEKGWTDIDSNNTVSSSNSTQLKFSHDSIGTKKVCVLTGSAFVLK